jgi:hypothetical protein
MRSSRSVLDRLSPPRRESSGSWSAGCDSRGKPEGGPFHPGGHRRGEDRTGQLREPSVMPREATSVRWDVPAGCRDWPWQSGKCRSQETTWPGVTIVPGVERHDGFVDQRASKVAASTEAEAEVAWTSTWLSRRTSSAAQAGSRRGFSSALWRRRSSLVRDLPIADVRSSHPGRGQRTGRHSVPFAAA